MTSKRAVQFDSEPSGPMPQRDPAECLRLAAKALSMGGLEDAARYTRMAAEIIDAHKRAH